MIRPPASSPGRPAALAALALALLYSLLQLAEWAGLLGSGGGPQRASTAIGLALLLTPSLLLGPAFVLMVAAAQDLLAPADRAYGRAALAFAAAYAALTGMVYFIQLTLVAPRLDAPGGLGGLEYLRFTPFASFLYVVDLFGYAMMSLACAALASGLRGSAARSARLALAAVGAVLPFLVLQMFWRPAIFAAALWAVAFPAACIMLARLFVRAPRPD